MDDHITRVLLKVNVDGKGRDGIVDTEGTVAVLYAAGAFVIGFDTDLIDRDLTLYFGKRRPCGAIRGVISHDYQ